LALVNNILELAIFDDGRGVPANNPSSSRGLGLWSMQERVVELSGYCRIEPVASGGALVSARLPCSMGGQDRLWNPSVS
jgi:signal transduction histidine kinase